MVIDGNCILFNQENVWRTSVSKEVSNAILSGAYLSYAILSGAYLSYAILSGAYLSYAILSGVDLSYAILSYPVLIYPMWNFSKCQTNFSISLIYCYRYHDKINWKGMECKVWFLSPVEIWFWYCMEVQVQR